MGALVGARAGNPSLLARARTRAEPSARAPACAGGSVGARARARIGRVAHAGARIQGRSPVRHSHPVRKARGADERARAHVVSTDLFPRPKRIGVALRAREQLLRLKGHLRQIWHAKAAQVLFFQRIQNLGNGPWERRLRIRRRRRLRRAARRSAATRPRLGRRLPTLRASGGRRGKRGSESALQSVGSRLYSTRVGCAGRRWAACGCGGLREPPGIRATAHVTPSAVNQLLV